jgi:RHS repeat-associated protein
LLKTVQTAYTYQANPETLTTDDGAPTAASVLPTTVTTTLDNGMVTKVVNVWDTNLNTPIASGLSYGNLLEKQEYVYGNGSPGPLLRRTDYTYLAFNNSQYLALNMLDRVASVTVYNGSGTQISQTTYGYDETSPVASGISTNHVSLPAGTLRGNQTSVCHWLNTTGGNLCTYTTYYDTGMPYQVTDPLGNVTTYSYSSTYAGAYVTQTTMPQTGSVQHVTSGTYDFGTGKLTSFTDQSGLTSNYQYDSLWRMTTASFADGGQTTFSFPNLLTTQRQKSINSSLTRTDVSLFDGLARPIQTQLTSDPQGTVYTDTTYDALGRVTSVSNPYRTGTDITTTTGITTYGYDALSRKTSETYPDGSILTTAYCGPTTLVTDPTGRWRRSTTDALGHLIEVDEPNAPGATVNSNGCPGTGEPIWVTSYTNDTLGNLTQVVQNGSHQRNFTYDSLGRLLTSSNPEVGTITYKYDADPNCASPNSYLSLLVSKTDARGIRTCTQYDALKRETVLSYSNGDPTITTTYDQSACLGLSTCQNVGHRTGMTDAAGSESWSYQADPANLRSVHADQRTTNSSPSNITKTSIYYLDLAGNVTQAVYPTGRIVNYTVDAADRPSTAVDGSNGITYASGFQASPGGTCLVNATCYTPQGTFYALSIGQTSSFTGLNLTHIYNNRLQPQEFKASSPGGTAIDITYSFVDPSTNKNAGHVWSVTNNLDTTRSQNFTYDQLNRLAAAQTTSTFATSPSHCWGESYGLDPWGNLQSLAGGSSQYTGCTYESGFTRTADSNNHLSGFSYDASGNTNGDGYNSYTWNAESQLKVTAGSTYLYDGDGRRVAKANTAVPPVPYELYWYGAGGDILAETDSSGNTTAEYVFFGGERVAMLPASGTPIYYVEDLLGTSRVTTTNTGVVCYDADFYPYGGERSYTNTCPQNYKFEGKERDTETGNDDFGARSYSNRFGRWLSADWSAVPVAVPYANLNNPQTLNLYSMVSDDPESFADLDGHADAGPEPDPAPGHCNSTKCRVMPPDPMNGPPASQYPQRPAQDYAIGALKEIGNTLASADPGSALLGSPFAASDETQAMAMTGVAILGLLIPGGGEEKVVAKAETKLAAKAVNLPAWKTVVIDLEHILSGHTEGGTRAIQSGLKDLFPRNMSEKQIENAIRQAYRGASKAGASQGERVLLQGKSSGLTIKMWVNIAQKVIESAWPKF